MERSILFISNRFEGLEAFVAGGKPAGMPMVYKLLEALVKRGYHVHWLLNGGGGTSRGTADLLGGKIRVTSCTPLAPGLIYRLDRTKFRHTKLPQLAFGLATLWKGHQVLRREPVSLIYGAGPTGAWVGGLLALRHRLPRISRLYGSFLHVQKLRGRAQWLCYHYPAEPLVFKWPGDALIVTNDGTRGDLLAKRFGTDPERFYFLLNGVDKSDQADRAAVRSAVRARLGIPDGTPLLVTVSRLDDWKRVDRAIRAASVLKSQRIDCRLAIVGGGHERPRLEALARSSGAGETVIFLGELPHAEAVQILRSADVFLSLYDYSNLGNPVIEAMSSGQCIVSIADGSLEGLVADGVNGVLVRPDALEDELPARLAALIRDPEERMRLGSAAKRTADATFWTSKQRIAAELDIIETLCSGGRLDKARWMAKWGMPGAETRQTNAAQSAPGSRGPMVGDAGRA